jgi:hypothetical protein
LFKGCLTASLQCHQQRRLHASTVSSTSPELQTTPAAEEFPPSLP